MSGQVTASDVAAQLGRLAVKLDELVDSLDDAEVEAVNRREDYTLALSKAFLRSEGPMDVRKHRSIDATHSERLAAELAEAHVRALRRQIDTIRIRIDVGRSMGAAIRSEISLGGYGGGT